MFQSIIICLFTFTLFWTTGSTDDFKCQYEHFEGNNYNIQCTEGNFDDLRKLLNVPHPSLRSIQSVTFKFGTFDIISKDDLVRTDAMHTLEYNFENNHIRTLYINATDKIQSFHNNIVQSLEGEIDNEIFGEIDLSKNVIGKIEPGTFNNVRISELNLERNQLTNIKPKTFTNLRNVRRLTLANNNITYISEDSFVNFTRSYSSFTPIPQPLIDLSYNKIQKIEQNAFVLLPQIHKVDLSHNNLTRFDGRIFNHVNLTTLSLSFNQISYIAPTAFENLGSLIVLRLNNNELKTLESKLFSSLNYLALLHLSDNPLHEIEPYAFSGVRSLNQDILGNAALFMKNIKIPVIRTAAFNGLSALSELDLSNWEITKIEAKAFADLTSLKILHLDNNNLTDIVPDTFYGLDNIDLIDLSYNKLTKLTKDMFQGLNGSKYLDQLELESKEHTPTLKDLLFGNLDAEKYSINLILKHNEISTIDKDAFAYLGNLHLLDLSENKITNIQIGTFKGLRFVVKLDLHSNKLTKLDKEVLYPMVRLADLDISNNQIQEFEIRYIIEHSMNAAFKMINLNNNNWTCDNLKYIISYLTDSKIDFLSSSPEHFDSHNVHGIRCVPKEEDISNKDDPTELFFSSQRTLINLGWTQAIVLIFFFIVFTLGFIAFISLYVVRNRTYFERTFSNLRSSRTDDNQSTVELINVPN